MNSYIELQSCNCNRCFGKKCNITKGIWRVQQMDKLGSEFHVIVTETASLPGMTITSQWTSLIIVYKSNWAFMTRHESTSRDSDTNWLEVLRRHSRGIKLSPRLSRREEQRHPQDLQIQTSWLTSDSCTGQFVEVVRNVILTRRFQLYYCQAASPSPNA